MPIKLTVDPKGHHSFWKEHAEAGKIKPSVISTEPGPLIWERVSKLYGVLSKPLEMDIDAITVPKFATYFVEANGNPVNLISIALCDSSLAVYNQWFSCLANLQSMPVTESIDRFWKIKGITEAAFPFTTFCVQSHPEKYYRASFLYTYKDNQLERIKKLILCNVTSEIWASIRYANIDIDRLSFFRFMIEDIDPYTELRIDEKAIFSEIISIRNEMYIEDEINGS